jgi:hypothetical protein
MFFSNAPSSAQSIASEPSDLFHRTSSFPPRRVSIVDMKLPLVIAIALLLSSHAMASPQAPKPPTANSDRLGLTCTQILQMTSTQWVERFIAKKSGDTQSKLRAVAAYGKCYDARTDQLAATLAKSGTGPLTKANENFHDFDQAVTNFVAKGLAITDPPADELKSAYAALYEKQFRYEFLRARRQKISHPNPLTPEELEETGNAKTQFGQELDALPIDKMRELHAAFSKMFDAPLSDSMKLQIYRFAIFVLEPPSAKPFAPPPF